MMARRAAFGATLAALLLILVACPVPCQTGQTAAKVLQYRGTISDEMKAYVREIVNRAVKGRRHTAQNFRFNDPVVVMEIRAVSEEASSSSPWPLSIRMTPDFECTWEVINPNPSSKWPARFEAHTTFDYDFAPKELSYNPHMGGFGGALTLMHSYDYPLSADRSPNEHHILWWLEPMEDGDGFTLWSGYRGGRTKNTLIARLYGVSPEAPPTEVAAVQPPQPTPEPQPAPQQQPEEEEEDDSLYLDLMWLHRISKSVAGALHESALTNAKLSLQRIAAKKLGMRIEQLESFLKAAHAGDERVFETVLNPENLVWQDYWGGQLPAGSRQAAVSALEKKVAELRQQYAEILQDQDDAISRIFPLYDNILSELRKVGGRSKHEKVTRAAAAFEKLIGYQRDLDRLQLPLAAGQSERLQSQAEDYIRQSKYEPIARLMQGLDFIENGRPRLALQALRLSLQANEKLRAQSDANPDYLLPAGKVRIATNAIRRMEVAYLHKINAKMTGEAHEVYQKCKTALLQPSQFGVYEHSPRYEVIDEDGWWQTIKDYTCTGLFSMIGAIRDDTPGGQADLMGEITWDAAVNHGALLLMMRLRDRGLTLDEIRALDDNGLIDFVRTKFTSGGRPGPTLTPQQARRMRAALVRAFEHPDVMRLWATGKSATDIQKDLQSLDQKHRSGQISDTAYRHERAALENRLRLSRQQLQADTGTSYFADVEQVDSYFHGGAFEYHWVEYMGDLINAKNLLVMLGPSTAVSVDGELAMHGSAYYSAEQLAAAVTPRSIFLERVLRMPEVADALYKSRHGARIADELLKLAEPGGRIAAAASGTARFVASIGVQMGIVQSCSMLGEAVGGTVGEVLSGEEEARKDALVGREVGEMAGMIVTALGAGDLTEAVNVLKAAQVRHVHLQQLTRALQVATQQLDDMAVSNNRHIQRISRALQETEAGNLSSSSSQMLERSIGELDDEFAGLLTQIKQGSATMDLVQHAYRLRALREVCLALKSGKQPAAQYARVMLEEIQDEIARRLNQVQTRKIACEAIESSFARSPPTGTRGGLRRPSQAAVQNPGLEPSAPLVGDGLDDLARAKLVEGAPALLRNANRLLMEGEYRKAVGRYKELLTFLKEMGNEGSTVGQELVRNLRLARRAWSAHQRLTAVDPGAITQVTERFRPGEVDDIIRRSTGAGASVRLQRMAEATYTKPYWVVEKGRRIAVFKPAEPSGRDLKAEMLYYEFARRLGYNCPACAPATMQTPDRGQVNGIIVRYVEGTALKDCDAGLRLAARREIARDKVLSALLGDHDRHFGNYLASEGRGTISIDHGMCDFDDMIIGQGGRDTIRLNMVERIRLGRQFYRQMAQVDPLLHYADIQEAVREIQGLADELETLLKPIFSNPDELNAVLPYIRTRLELLPDVMHECYGPAAGVTWHRPESQPFARFSLKPESQYAGRPILPVAA